MHAVERDEYWVFKTRMTCDIIFSGTKQLVCPLNNTALVMEYECVSHHVHVQLNTKDAFVALP